MILFLMNHLFASAGPLAAPLLKPLAYLDPGSGSFILQIILASLLASLLFFKSFWAKLLGVFRKQKPSEDDDLQDDSDEHKDL